MRYVSGVEGSRARGAWSVVDLARDRRGGSAVQYLIIVGCVALVALVAFRFFGRSLLGMAALEGEKVAKLEDGCPNNLCQDSNGSHDQAAPAARAPGRASRGGGGHAGAPGGGSPSAGGDPGAGPASPDEGFPSPIGESPGGASAPGTGSNPSAPSSTAPSNPTSSPTLAQRCLRHDLCTGGIGLVLGVLQGAAPGGFITNFIPNVVPEELTHNFAYNYWNGAGQVLGGVGDVIGGAGTEGFGVVADATGVGAVVGVPANVAGAVLMANGVASVTTGAAKMEWAVQHRDELEHGGATPPEASPPEAPGSEPPARQADKPSAEPAGQQGDQPGKPTSGNTPSTEMGNRIHAERAAARRASGQWDDVNTVMKDKSGNDIIQPKRVDLKTGAPQPGTPDVTVRPDAVSYARGEILDDKPFGRSLGGDDRQEIIRYINAYQEKTGEMPKRILIERYDPQTGAPVRTEIYKPEEFLPPARFRTQPQVP